ncbi:serine/threonine protein kinase, bacterial [Amycolatopsis coloradensis]|uniref:non-specific serine/threonine protein kinase n=1 Tax=Amycolatopsis coloradensis TaxID=76021 RepID=A0A1R0KYI9_9PSEU|nr:serine/threonine-protein kinase [Amycolatopsis coloradensis]OLZ54415.1 serine/threonine protein kinase, bacterial [Amycolatopsis coloradensis]
MTACERGGCPGALGKTGFCKICGLPPGPPEEPARREKPTLVIPGPGDAPTRITSTVVTRSQQMAGHATADDRVPLPIVELPDVAGRLLTEPHVPEEERFCGKHGCTGTPVGRSIGGGTAPAEGFCPVCRTPFSFSPKLAAGDVVDGRYQVLGCVARGGLGFVYLATDSGLGGMHVALKGLINTNNTAAVRIAETESQVLTALEHPNIVRILNVVGHEGFRYIVMEFVDGLSLREIKNRGRAGLDSSEGRLLVEHVVAYGREILTALDYLHGEGLLYCDMKPDNVIHGEKRIKLIDFGAIRKISDDESPAVGTEHYQVTPRERAKHGLTVRSDIHTVGVTLRELFQASDGWSVTRDARGVRFGIESFIRVLDRATAPFEQRFATAREMLVQLDGVLGEILSLRDRQSRPAGSTLFTEGAVLLDAGLGQAPPLEHWTRGTPVSLGDRPAAAEIAVGLPLPREDPEDSQANFLRAVRAPDAARLLKKLDKVPGSVEVEFRRCRARLELGATIEGALAVAEAERLLGERAVHDWRVAWHRGLLALGAGDFAAAKEKFAAVYRDIPGEEPPKLALGLCEEHLNGAAAAERYYDALWARDRSQVSAAFGLARVRLLRGNRAAAVEILDQVPEFSRYDEAARIAGVRVLSAPMPGTGDLPASAELDDAVVRLSALDLDGDALDRLVTAVRETALAAVLTGQDGITDGEILRSTETGARTVLDKSYRRLAHHAPAPEPHDVLIDLANSVRPVTLV